MSKFEDLAPAGNDWVVRELKALRAEVEELRAAKSAEATTIASGGLDIKDGGSLVISHPDTGNIIFYAGISALEGGAYAVTQHRNDGTATLVPRRFTDPSHPLFGIQYLGWHDRQGNIIFSDDPGGKGMREPRLPMSLTPQFTTTDAVGQVFQYRNLPIANLSGETTLWEGASPISHSYVEINGTWGSASGSSSSTYRLYVNGVEVGTWSRTGTQFGSTIEGPFEIPETLIGFTWASVRLSVAASGTGNVACEVYGCYQRGTPI